MAREIDCIAAEFAKNKDFNTKTKLIDTFFEIIVNETQQEKTKRFNSGCDTDYEYAWIFDVYARKKLIINVFNEFLKKADEKSTKKFSSVFKEALIRETINTLANEYIKNKEPWKKDKIIYLILYSLVDENDIERTRRLEINNDLSSLPDYAWIYGICAPKDLILAVISEALGEKINKDGSISKSKYNPDKGAKFTTYFTSLLKWRIGNPEYKNFDDAVSLDASENETDENGFKVKYVKQPFSEFEDPFDDRNKGISIKEHTMIKTASFFSELLKSKKVLSMTRGIYSLLFVNFSRKSSGEFPELNAFSDELFEPSEMGYINKYTTFEERVIKNFLGLHNSDLSEFAYKNRYDEAFSERETHIRVLKDYSVSDYYGENSLSYQKKVLLSELQTALTQDN